MRFAKMSASLLSALADFEQQEPAPPTAEVSEALALTLRPTGAAALLGARGAVRPPRAVVFVHCDEKANLDRLEAEGIQFNRKEGTVRTAYLPIDKLAVLSNHPKVKHIAPSVRLRPLLDVASTKVKLTSFKTNSGLTGTGVLVGIIDTGIDVNHPSFANRILRIWDQTVPGNGVAEGGYGRELTGAQRNESRDTDGHGTHVAGIAAGANTRFRGVAHKADIIAVKTSFQNAHIADAVRYIFRVAGELNKPAVINLSLGGHSDAHDGSDDLSATIDEVSGPGRIVCCAAGNEGNDNIHAQLALGAPGTRTARFSIPQNAVGLASLNGWYPGAAKLEVSLRSPQGLVTPFQPIIATGSPTRTSTLGQARITVTTPGPDAVNGDHNFVVTIRRTSPGAVPGGIWQLRVRNSANAPGKLDVWALDNQDAPTVLFTGDSIQDALKIGSPGAARRAVTVAAYTTRVQWKDIDGVTRQLGFGVDTIAEFSSEGPLRDGTAKPDIAAPGAMIASSMSAGSNPERAFILNDRIRLEAGTSMACPFIAGLVALLLERQPTLTPEEVKAMLKGAAAIPGQPSGTFDPKWGPGVIDCSALLEDTP